MRVSVLLDSKIVLSASAVTTKRSSLPKRLDANARRWESGPPANAAVAGDHAASLPPLNVIGPNPPPMAAEKSACQDQLNGWVMWFHAKSARSLIDTVTISPSWIRGVGFSSPREMERVPEATS